MTPSPDSPAPRLRWSGMTHVGRYRQNNEDSFLALTYDAREVHYLGKVGESSLAQGDFVFAVSDGMGGAKSGEFASRMVVQQVMRLMPRSYKLAVEGINQGFGDVLEEICHQVHAEISKMGRMYHECAGMGATLSLACFSTEFMHFAHVGDSRIYYLPSGGSMIQVTEDHSHVGWLRRQGKLNEREARMHPAKNRLDQALGAGQQNVRPHIGSVRYQSGDRFLICSDGITDALWDFRIADHLSAPADEKPRAYKVVEHAVAESGRDNCTAICIEVE
ncbi:PP2C family protein-serine/threonine phosphatase [Brevifollis gellanilyticus]|nr:protein phosphatase 2C domain-containing protein [Brevifollis gellanilyticus]